MALVIAGIDEAGYGPMLGPLCVGLAVLRLDQTPADGHTPDLWKLLETGVCREPGRGGKNDPLGRIAVADSKKLKLSNSVTTTDPVVHLERGVLSFCRAAFGTLPASDTALFERLCVDLGPAPWYIGSGASLPAATTAGELALAAAKLEAALARAGVTVPALACDVTLEAEFNDAARDGGKAETTRRALTRHLRRVWACWAGHDTDDGDRLGIVCDRLGGRVQYADMLREALDDVNVDVVEESDRRSRYIIRGRGPDGDPRRAGIAFLTEGEDAHLPVALASMTAKLVRELAMRRFNSYWSLRAVAAGVDLKPTAGYSQDARRWLRDARPVVTPDERDALIRIA